MDNKENKNEKVALNDELLDKIAGGVIEYETTTLFCRRCGQDNVFVKPRNKDYFVCTVCLS